MRLVKNYPTIQPGETLDYLVDFNGYIPDAAIITQVLWSIAVRATLVNSIADSLTGSRIIGSPQILNRTQSIQRIGNLVAGNDYAVTITATLDDAETARLWTVLPCRDAA